MLSQTWFLKWNSVKLDFLCLYKVWLCKVMTPKWFLFSDTMVFCFKHLPQNEHNWTLFFHPIKYSHNSSLKIAPFEGYNDDFKIWILGYLLINLQHYLKLNPLVPWISEGTLFQTVSRLPGWNWRVMLWKQGHVPREDPSSPANSWLTDNDKANAKSSINN